MRKTPLVSDSHLCELTNPLRGQHLHSLDTSCSRARAVCSVWWGCEAGSLMPAIGCCQPVSCFEETLRGKRARQSWAQMGQHIHVRICDAQVPAWLGSGRTERVRLASQAWHQIVHPPAPAESPERGLPLQSHCPTSPWQPRRLHLATASRAMARWAVELLEMAVTTASMTAFLSDSSGTCQGRRDPAQRRMVPPTLAAP